MLATKPHRRRSAIAVLPGRYGVGPMEVWGGREQDPSDHLAPMSSPRPASLALDALDPVNHSALNCTFDPWSIGGGGTL
ncbi:hypothetical protein ACFWFQ_00575 [Nocardia salmonicida]|uniref:hypothetical protein n=1 Tax=Nocardia salmonicida TaxID=53431 RepID=UPI003655E049